MVTGLDHVLHVCVGCFGRGNRTSGDRKGREEREMGRQEVGIILREATRRGKEGRVVLLGEFGGWFKGSQVAGSG